MTEKKPGDPDKRDFSLARKALSGLSGPKGDKEKPPADAPADGGSVLEQLVSALKKGPTPLTAVEPEGYAYFEGARSGGEVGPESPAGAIEAVQRVLTK